MAGGKKAYVAVTVHDEAGQPFTFQVGEKVPDWAVEKITNPHIFEKPAKSDDEPEEEEIDTTSTSTSTELTAPPKVGKGSAAGAWAAYAEQLGLAVPAGAKKDEIIALVEDSKAE